MNHSTTPTIDLRSDTVTLPTPGMRQAMLNAPLGDDVIDIDPSVEALQAAVAERLGKEAAIFMPSGTMTNQIAVRLHCKPGDEFICEEGCHIYNYEQGAFAQLSGVVAKPIIGEGSVLKQTQLTNSIRPLGDHTVQTKLICLENTHNRGGGCVLPFAEVTAICKWAKENGLARHLDGARLFNAVVASGISAADWADNFDTVSVCFSKGLGAPVGSVLAGPKDLIIQARRHRKLFGGGMRQAGVIASAALYALENQVDRLAEDHANAKLLGEAIANTPGLKLRPAKIDTNIVIFEVDPTHGTAAQLCQKLEANGVRMLPFGPQLIRAVTHLNITADDIESAALKLKHIC